MLKILSIERSHEHVRGHERSREKWQGREGVKIAAILIRCSNEVSVGEKKAKEPSLMKRNENVFQSP